METQVELYPLKERVKIAALAVFGSYVEWYDYFIAATAAALVWSDVFFSAYPYLSTVFSIAAFGVWGRPRNKVKNSYRYVTLSAKIHRGYIAQKNS